MSAGNERFNDEAADWDKNPSVQESSRLAFAAISPLITSLSAQKKASATGVEDAGELHVLEVGCGTGLLTLRVAPLVASVVAIDPAEGMIETLKRKIHAQAQAQVQVQAQAQIISNITPLCTLLTSPDDPLLPARHENNPNGPRRKFDLILSHLVMHHVPDLPSFLATLYACLAPGGHVALSDFEDFGPGARMFHPPNKMDGVERDGIGRVWMEEAMRRVGFADVRVEVRWKLRKSVDKWEGKEQGETMEFPFLLCEGVRKR
ncbi:S-adenosyl-L-methionine-dependent methyltransferase [Aspergillus heterothallicus]